jgi:hypothetical protein
MKRFLVRTLAIAFVAICWTSFANAKEIRIIADIGGQGQHVAVMGDDGYVEFLFLPNGEVIPAGDLFKKEATPAFAPKKKEPKKTEKNRIANLRYEQVEQKAVVSAATVYSNQNAFSGTENIKKIEKIETNNNEQKLLSNWQVMDAEYAVNKKGEKKQIRLAIRSPNEVSEVIDPEYNRAIELAKEGKLAIMRDRYDMHEYVKPTEKAVKSGTVVYFMLEPQPSWSKEDVVREVYDQVEIQNRESGQFVLMKKPKALRITYIDEYHKKIEEIRVIPTPQMYEDTCKNKIPST